MSYDLEIDQTTHAVIVRARCLLNQDIRRNILSDVSVQLGKTGLSRTIIDLTEATFNPDEPMAGALDLTLYMRSIGISPEVKLAFIYSDAEDHRQYFEHVAQMDGFKIRYFREIASAIAWLS